MRKLADAAEAASVLTATGRVLVDSYDSSNAIVPLLAAVSPNRDSGPCIDSALHVGPLQLRDAHHTRPSKSAATLIATVCTGRRP